MQLLLSALLATALIVASSGAPSSCAMCEIPNTIGNFTGQRPVAYAEPVGNTAGTGTVFSVQGDTARDDMREYLVNFGLVSHKGVHSRPTPYHDKVVLYTGMSAQKGTGDVWSINPLLTQEPGSGSYNAQGIELDFNNNNAHRGEADAGYGLAEPVSYGFSVTGASQYRSTSAIGVMGRGPPTRQWNRGIVFANDAVQQSTFQDLGNPDKSVDIRGSPNYGVYQGSTTSKNYFAGKTGVGPGFDQREPSAALEVAGDIHYTGELFHAPQGATKRPAILGSSTAKQHRLLSGTANLDKEGHAEVRVESRDALEPGVPVENYDIAYSLTAVGAAMPHLHVASELTLLSDGRTLAFSVGGGATSKKVSWQLGLVRVETDAATTVV